MTKIYCKFTKKEFNEDIGMKEFMIYIFVFIVKDFGV